MVLYICHETSKFCQSFVRDEEKLTKILPSLAIQGYNSRALPASITCPLRISLWTLLLIIRNEKENSYYTYEKFSYIIMLKTLYIYFYLLINCVKSTWLFSPLTQQTFSSLSSWSSSLQIRSKREDLSSLNSLDFLGRVPVDIKITRVWRYHTTSHQICFTLINHSHPHYRHT